jgi:methionine sulfoxide reductase catalytic subunit
MLIRKPDDIRSNEMTPKHVYQSRRLFMKSAVLAGSVAATGGVYRLLNTAAVPEVPRERLANFVAPRVKVDEAQTPLEDIAHYNNFYEFSSTSKQRVASLARNFVTKPWQVSVSGLCAKPATFDLDDLLKLPQEERIYRMRCVEAWSMVIPWAGFPLSTLLNKVEPTSAAKYVRFETLLDPQRLPNQNSSDLNWPYVEGLRMDEAMHPLTILATGLYGSALPPQNGAPVRLVVPWKYGFKGIKSIVKIQLVANEPVSTWTDANSSEYGFYSNVNPNVSHPRWSQATERRIGEFRRRTTLMFNGYGDQVAHLYSGMDLRRFF